MCKFWYLTKSTCTCITDKKKRRIFHHHAWPHLHKLHPFLCRYTCNCTCLIFFIFYTLFLYGGTSNWGVGLALWDVGSPHEYKEQSYKIGQHNWLGMEADSGCGLLQESALIPEINYLEMFLPVKITSMKMGVSVELPGKLSRKNSIAVDTESVCSSVMFSAHLKKKIF